MTVLDDFFVWNTLNQRDWAIALLTPEQRAASQGGIVWNSDPQTVALTGEECQAARRRFDRQVVELMKLRGSGRDVPPPNEYGLRPVLAWRGNPITEEAARAAWDRHHANETTPCHCTRTIDPNAVGFAEYDPPIGDHPTDAEIVERVVMHASDSFDTLRIRGHRVVKAEQSAAQERHRESETAP